MQKEIRNLLKEGEIDKTLKELRQERSLKPEHKKDIEGLNITLLQSKRNKCHRQTKRTRFPGRGFRSCRRQYR
jgi:hypothetical protein